MVIVNTFASVADDRSFTGVRRLPSLSPAADLNIRRPIVSEASTGQLVPVNLYQIFSFIILAGMRAADMCRGETS